MKILESDLCSHQLPTFALSFPFLDELPFHYQELKWYFLSMGMLLLAVMLWQGRGLCNLRLTWSHYRLFTSATGVVVLCWKKCDICCMLFDFGGRNCCLAMVLALSYFGVSVLFFFLTMNNWPREIIPCKEDLYDQLLSHPFDCWSAFEQVWAV